MVLFRATTTLFKMLLTSSLLCLHHVQHGLAAPTVVDGTTNVTYVGLQTVNGTVDKFLNIPYGADTSGAGRFANPQPAVLAPGTVVNASAQGPVCPQVASDGFQYQTNSTWFSEDCLRLKVARPAGTKAGDRLPVMVYIYGGGLWNGNINERTNEPDGLIQQSVANGLPVVYVAMNYRLNVFGFALNDALNATDALNLGLKDQRLALEWTRAHIAAFGGDPDRITIFGQSSGALSVTLQILAYGGGGDRNRNGSRNGTGTDTDADTDTSTPFHGALIESTALEPNMTSPLTRTTFAEVAVQAGCATDEPTAQTAATLACLRALPLAALWNATLAVYDALSATTDGDIWLPAVDGTFLPAAPSALVRAGRFAPMPLVVGWTRNDATLFTPTTIATAADTRAFVGGYYPYLSEAHLETLLGLYDVGDFAANATANLSAEFYRSAEMFRDILLTCPSFYLGHAMATKYANANASTPIPVYMYEHNQTILSAFLASQGAPGLGVIHTSELAYVFGNFTPYQHTYPAGLIHPSAADERLLAQASRSWSTFAATGQPSRPGHDTLPGWAPAYATAGAGMLEASLYVIGGPAPGMSALGGEGANPDVVAQQLEARCGFLNREDVIAQLKY